MIDLIMEKLQSCYTLTPRDMGAYADIHKNGMRFHMAAFEVSGVGNLSTIRMSAMLGLMRMETVVVTPLRLDAPLYSCDQICAMGKDTLLLELYDTQLAPIDLSALAAVKQKYAGLADHDLGSHWYDKIKLAPSLCKRGKRMDAAYKPLIANYTDAYLSLLSTAAPCQQQEKQARVKEYVDGLFQNGGPSTYQFKKLLGEEKARELFERFVFAAR